MKKTLFAIFLFLIFLYSSCSRIEAVESDNVTDNVSTTVTTSALLDQNPFVADDNTIAFISIGNEFHHSDIFTISLNGTDLIQVTDSIAGESWINWSPDRKKLVFVSYPDDQLHILDSENGDQRLTENFSMVRIPVWSPDGTMIAFDARLDNNPAIWVINSDGTGLKNLSGLRTYCRYPAWSPDGSRIAFVSHVIDGYKITESKIKVINFDGTNEQTIVSDIQNPLNLTWSPDGKQILFVVSDGYEPGNIDDEPYSIYVVNHDGSGLKDLSKSLGGGYNPVWSPDGKMIAFLSNRKTLGFDPDQYNTFQLFVMSADGRNIKKIGDSWGKIPSWSPDSTRIAFIGGRPENYQLFTIKSDGTGLTKLTGLPQTTSVIDICWSTQY